MYIKRIKLTNYRIYHGTNSVDFLKYDNKNVSIVSGYNGFGKTTFLTSLVWCIYGKHMQEVQPYFKNKISRKGGYNKYLNASINHKAKIEGVDSFSVELELSDISIPGLGANELIIKRSYNIGDKEDSLEIFIDHKENELVEEIGKEIFIQDFILPKEIAKFFFFDAERITSIAEMNTIEDKRNLNKAYTEILGIKKYETLKFNLSKTKLKYAKESASKNDRKSLREFELFIEKTNNSIKETEFKIEQNNQSISEFKSQSDQLQVQLIREGSDMTINELEELRDQKEILTNEKKEINNSYKELLEILPFAMNIPLLKKIEERCQKEDNLDNDTSKLMISEIKSIESEISKKIKSQSDLEFIKRIVEEKIKSYTNIDTKEIHAFSKNDRMQLSSLINNINTNYNSRLKDIKRLININSSNYHKVIRKLYRAEIKSKDELIQDIRSQKDIVDEKISTLEQENFKLSIEIGSKTNQLNAKLSSFNELSKKVKISTNLQKKNELATRLISQLDDFLQKIKNNKKFALEKRILDSLNLLMHKNSFIKNVSVDISDDIIEINLYNSSDELINKDEFSEGEKQLYATSLLKALVEESNINFPVFVDSPLQKFDEKHTENIISDFYPSISDQVVIFPLLNKELSEKEYEKIKRKISSAIIINNIDEYASQLVRVEPDELFAKNKELNKVIPDYV